MTRPITLLALLTTASCAVPLDEKERNCPCSEGWTCCKAHNTCIADESYEALCSTSNGDNNANDNNAGDIDAGNTSAPDADEASVKSDNGDQEIICVPKEVECIDLKTKRTCDASGTMWAEEPCHDGHRCDNGACVPAEKIVGSLRFSVSVKAKDIILDIDPGEYTTRVGMSAWFYHSSDGLVAPKGQGPEGCVIRTNSSSGGMTGVLFDAGDIKLAGPTGTHTVTYDASTEFYAGKLGHFDSHFTPFPGFGKPLTYSGTGKGLVGAFNGSVTWPPKRLLTRPGPREELTNKKNDPLEIKWSGAIGQGQIGIDLIGMPEEIPPGTFKPEHQVRCDIDDDGAFTIPATIMAHFASDPKLMMIMRTSEHVTPFTAAGLSETEVIVDYYYWPSKMVLLTP